MFPQRYFPSRMFAARYFAKVGAEVVTIPPAFTKRWAGQLGRRVAWSGPVARRRIGR